MIVSVSSFLAGLPGTVRGFLYAAGAFGLWGLVTPVYFKMLSHVPALEILMHRVVWSVVLLAGVVLVQRRRSFSRGSGAKGRLWSAYGLSAMVATTLLVSANWLIFIWAVLTGRMVESSLGYFINPLINVLLGLLFLGERLTRRQSAAVGLAGLGVVILVISHGRLPTVALALATAFGFYSLLRKQAAVDPVAGLLVETALLTPVALAYFAFYGTALGKINLLQDLQLVGCGVITTLPLLLFLLAAQSLSLSTLGLMQYVTPTGHLLLAVLAYGEPFTVTHGLAFGCIWCGLLVYSSGTLFRWGKPPAIRRQPAPTPGNFQE